MELKKKGIATLPLLLSIFFGLVLMVILGIGVLSFDLVDDSFSQIEGSIGNQSINETYAATLQKGVIAAKTTAPRIISIGTLLGMVLVMMFVGYSTRKIGQVWLLLDIFILIAAEILVVAVRDSFVVFINSSPEFLAIFSGSVLSAGSKYILNAPVIIPIVWALVVVSTYFVTPKKEEGEQPLGFN